MIIKFKKHKKKQRYCKRNDFWLIKLRLHESLKNIIGFSFTIAIEYSWMFQKLNYLLIGKIPVLIKNVLIESLPWKLELLTLKWNI